MSGWSYAFALSKQQVAESEPPGTVKLIEVARQRSAEREDHIQLVPHPSLSPADPLNWPAWRKYTVLLVMSVYSGVVNFAAGIVAPTLPILMFQMVPAHGPPIALSRLSQLVAVNVLLTGTSNIFWVPLANTFGRRPILIVSMLLATLCSVWCGVAKDFSSLLAARAIQGAGFGPADTIAPDVIGEVFFVHERGRAIAFYTLWLAGGSTIGGLAGGYIAGNLGYKYIFWISTALLAFILLCEIFLVPETLFNRETHAQVDHAGTSIDEEKSKVQTTEHAAASSGETFTYAQSLSVGLYRGNLGKHLVSPWLSLAFPGTWVVMLHYGGLLGGLVTIATVGPQLLAAPPYLWGNNVGLINLGALIGILLGFVFTFLLADLLIKRQAKRGSRGLAEPESRLPAMFPALFLATTGIWTFGFCAANPSPKAWVGMVVGYGMVGFGITQIPSIGFNYLIDSYNAISADCFVMTTISRSVISFAWTFFCGEWVAKAGASLPFGIFGMLMGIFALLTIPLWLAGKRMRIATADYLPKEVHH